MMAGLPGTLRRFAFALSLVCGAAAQVAAQDCGGAETPCETESGGYNVLKPEDGVYRGVVMHLHGGGGTGRGMLKSGLAGASVDRGYLFIAPNGEHPEARWTKDWSVRARGTSHDRDDLVFLSEVLADAKERFGVGEGPVLLAGFSRGASMVWDVACRDPGFADAYAPVAGAFWDDLPETCEGPVRLFHTHGWGDRTVPLEGRSFLNGTVVQGDVFASLKILRETNGCGNRQPEESRTDDDFWYRFWTDCEAGRLDLLLHPGGHGAPRGWAGLVLDWFES